MRSVAAGRKRNRCLCRSQLAGDGPVASKLAPTAIPVAMRAGPLDAARPTHLASAASAFVPVIALKLTRLALAVLCTFASAAAFAHDAPDGIDPEQLSAMVQV